MELNVNLKGFGSNGFIGITPWAILFFGGLSLVGSGTPQIFKMGFLVFIWGVVSSLARQIYKDHVAFLDEKWTKKHKRAWWFYYSFQIILCIVFSIIIMNAPTPRLPIRL